MSSSNTEAGVPVSRMGEVWMSPGNGEYAGFFYWLHPLKRFREFHRTSIYFFLRFHRYTLSLKDSKLALYNDSGNIFNKPLSALKLQEKNSDTSNFLISGQAGGSGFFILDDEKRYRIIASRPNLGILSDLWGKKKQAWIDTLLQAGISEDD